MLESLLKAAPTEDGKRVNWIICGKLTEIKVRATLVKIRVHMVAVSVIDREPGHVFLKFTSGLLAQGRAGLRPFASLRNLSGKYHTGWLAAFAAVGLGQELQDFKYLGFFRGRKTRLYFIPFFSGFVDFLFEPLKNLVGFSLILQGVDGDHLGMKGN